MRTSAPRSCAVDLLVVTIEAPICLRRRPGYVARGTMLRVVRDACGLAGIGRVGSTYLGGLEALEEREERVGRAVTAGFRVRWRGAVERALFERHVGVDVLVGRVERLMAE